MNRVHHEDALTRRITRWATGNADVRVALLTSSRTVPHASLDALSDHDVLLYAMDATHFDRHDSWLHALGDVLVQFRDPRIHDSMPEYSRLVLYTDGTKIDFTIVAVEEFWWESTYVAKNLWRDELLTARYCFDSVMRHQLLRRMLEWYIETQSNWSWKPGVFGRGMKHMLSPSLWQTIEETFAGASIEENWQALFRMTALFRAFAIEVATRLGYTYRQELDAGVTAYLEKIRSMPHTPT